LIQKQESLLKKTSSGLEFDPETGEPVFDKSRNKNRRY